MSSSWGEISAIAGLVVTVLVLLAFVFYQRSSLDDRDRETQQLMAQCLDSIQAAKKPKEEIAK